MSDSSSEDEDISKFASVAVTGDDIAKSAEENSKKVKRDQQKAIARRNCPNGISHSGGGDLNNSDEELEVLDAAALRVAKALEQRLEKELELDAVLHAPPLEDLTSDDDHDDASKKNKKKKKKKKKKSKSKDKDNLDPLNYQSLQHEEENAIDADADDSDGLCLFKGVIFKPTSLAALLPTAQQQQATQSQAAIKQSAPQIRPKKRQKKTMNEVTASGNQGQHLQSNHTSTVTDNGVNTPTTNNDNEEEEVFLEDCLTVVVESEQLLAAIEQYAQHAKHNIATVDPTSEDEENEGGRAKQRRLKRDREAKKKEN